MSISKLYPLIKNGLYGLQDESGQTILSPKYDYIQISDDERLRYLHEGCWGLLDRQGKVIVSHDKYDNIWSASYGYYVIVKDDKHGLIDADGNLLIPPTWDDFDCYGISFLDEGFTQPILIARRDDKYGAINNHGQVIIPVEYEEMSPLKQGLISVCAENEGLKDGLKDENGNTIIPIEYDESSIEVAGNGLIIAAKSGYYGCINRQNQTVIPFKYEDIESCGPELCAVKLSEQPERWNCINKAGELLLDDPCERIEYVEGIDGIMDSMIICKARKGKYFALTSNGILSLPSDKHAVYTADGKTIVWMLDMGGEVIVNPGVENINLANRFDFLMTGKIRKLTFKPGVTCIGKGWEDFTSEQIDIYLPSSIEKVDSDAFVKITNCINAIYVPHEAINHITHVLPRFLVPFVKEQPKSMLSFLQKIWPFS